MERLFRQSLAENKSPKTIEKWISIYTKGGMDALIPKSRLDKGGTRVITPEAELEIHRIRKEYPRLNATQIHDHLVREAILPATVSVSSVQRYVKNNGLRGGTEGEAKDRKAFEAGFFGELWQADTCYLPYIREEGRSRRSYLLMILDDHSRMIVGSHLESAGFQQGT